MGDSQTQKTATRQAYLGITSTDATDRLTRCSVWPSAAGCGSQFVHRESQCAGPLSAGGLEPRHGTKTHTPTMSLARSITLNILPTGRYGYVRAAFSDDILGTYGGVAGPTSEVI